MRTTIPTMLNYINQCSYKDSATLTDDEVTWNLPHGAVGDGTEITKEVNVLLQKVVNYSEYNPGALFHLVMLNGQSSYISIEYERRFVACYNYHEDVTKTVRRMVFFDVKDCQISRQYICKYILLCI